MHHDVRIANATFSYVPLKAASSISAQGREILMFKPSKRIQNAD